MKSTLTQLKYIPELDGLRAIAILSVLLVHFSSVNENAWIAYDSHILSVFYKFILFGAQGVTLFFLLSGYLITRILLSSISSADYFKTFFMRRFLRIFPLYYLVLFISFILYPMLFSLPADAIPIYNEQWKLWTYLSNVHFFHFVMWDTPDFFHFGHFWTLSVEEHFYLLWPFLIYFIPKHRLPMWMVGVFLISLSAWFLGIKIEFFNWTTLTHSGSLALGGLIAYYESKNPKSLIALSQKFKKYFYFTIIIFFIAILIPRNLGFRHDFTVYLFALAGFSSILIIVLNHEVSMLKTKGFIFIGKISYGIYVYHALLRPYFKQYIYSPLLEHFSSDKALVAIIVYTIISIAISIAIAWMSWELYEKQILKLKRYFTYNAIEKESTK